MESIGGCNYLSREALYELGLCHGSSYTSANDICRTSVPVLLSMIIIINSITQRVVTTAISSNCLSFVPPQRTVGPLPAMGFDRRFSSPAHFQVPYLLQTLLHVSRTLC